MLIYDSAVKLLKPVDVIQGSDAVVFHVGFYSSVAIMNTTNLTMP
jgi:hypothetical protein